MLRVKKIKIVMFSRREILSLYKKLLQLHNKLPKEFKEVGVIYIREEFKSHKKIEDPIVIKKFMNEWKVY